MPVESTPTIRLEEPVAAMPAPTPPSRVVVAKGVDVEPLLGAAVGTVEMLRSALEATRGEAESVEQALRDVPADSEADAEWKSRLQVIYEEVRHRRSCMDAELEAARSEAAELVAAARADAAQITRAAEAELDRTLSSPDSAGPARGSVDPVRPAATIQEAPAEPVRVRLDDQASDAAEPAFAPGAARDAEPSGSAHPLASEPPPPELPSPDPEPQLPPAAFSPSGMPPFVAVMVPSPDGSGPPSYVLAPTVGMAQWSSMAAMPPTGAMPAAPPAASSYTPVAAVSSYLPAAPPYPYPVQPPSPQPGPMIDADPGSGRRGGISRVFHIDVILPLVAVAIVIVVLLAWLG
jgi:hypothetical protein